MNPTDFYNELADDYDSMTRFAARLERERARMQQLAATFSIRTCIDAACGTGLHAIALAQAGIAVTGADLSPAMLEKAGANAVAAGVDIPWLRTSFAELSQHMTRRVDALLCLGNSIPHVLTDDELAASLQSFKEVLAPGGICVIQLLNYARILETGERIVGARRQGDLEFIRFYDFLIDEVRFNILRLRWNNNDLPETTLHTTRLRPYTAADLTKALETAGFETVEAFADLEAAAFDVQSSTNLVLIARSPDA